MPDQTEDNVVELQQYQSPFYENLAEKENKDTLKRIGATVVEDYKTDLASRASWDERTKDWYTLFSGLVETKTFPWDGASNVNVPLMSISSLQFQARVYDALLPPKEIAKCVPMDGAAINNATRAQKYFNWQLTEQMEEWEDDMDILFLLLPIFGSGVKKTYFDAILGRNVSKTLRHDEFVAPYGVKRLEDAPRKTHVYDMYLNDIKIKGENKIWINTDKINDPGQGNMADKPADEYREVSDKVTGISESSEQKDKPRVILEQHRTWDLDGDGIEEPYMITVDLETETVFRIESLLYPNPFTKKETAFDYFTAYTFIPNPDSWMGYGFGHLLEHLNHSTNSLINQLIDAGTLSNTISGFYNRRGGIRDTDIEFIMGQFKSVDVPADDIRKSFYQFQFNPPSNVLFALLQLLQNYSRELSSVSESMLGKLPPSDTTATSMLAVMEQGLKVFSTIHKRMHRVLKKELKKLALLNSIYLDDEIYFMVQDSTSGEMLEFQSGRLDFLQVFDVVPVSDPSISSRAEKLIKARQAYELGMQNPDIANDALARYELTKGLFEALEVQNIDKILKKPEPPPPPPDLRPEEEESEFLAERYVEPLPQQDHAAHLESHQIFKDSDWAMQLTPQGKKLLEAHLRETWALFYMQQKQLEETIRNEMLTGGATGMAQQPVQ